MSKPRALLTILLVVIGLVFPSISAARPGPRWGVGFDIPDSGATPQPGSDGTQCSDVQEGCVDISPPDGSTEPSNAVPETLGPPPPQNDLVRLASDGVVRLVFFWSDT